jgi:hypothetical protein
MSTVPTFNTAVGAAAKPGDHLPLIARRYYPLKRWALEFLRDFRASHEDVPNGTTGPRRSWGLLWRVETYGYGESNTSGFAELGRITGSGNRAIAYEDCSTEKLEQLVAWGLDTDGRIAGVLAERAIEGRL